MHIALLLVLLLLVGVSAADETDPDDLGVITATVGVGLEPCKTRKDFDHFLIEFLPQQWPTNKVTLVTTNKLLVLDDLVAVPHGPTLMGVRSVCADGTESPIRVYKLDIRRDPPTTPRAYRVFTATKPHVSPTTEQLLNGRRLQHSLTNQLPPTPGASKPTSLFPGPLPKGKAMTYSQHMDEMREYYARGQTAPHKSAL